MTTTIPDAVLDLIHAAVDRAGLGLTREQVAADAVRGTWYTDLALKAYALGQTTAAAELPTITLPWADYGCRVAVDDDGNIGLGIEPFADILDCGADEATEVAAALLAAAAASRDITGDRPVITIRPPALAAETGPWRWELRVAGRLGSWVVHRHSTLAPAESPEGLARLVADQHLEDRPAELRDTPWQVFVWRADETTLTPETAAARVTSSGMVFARALGDGGLAGILQPGSNLVRRDLLQEMRTGGATQTRRCCGGHTPGSDCSTVGVPCCEQCPDQADDEPLIPAMPLDELEQICADARRDGA